MMCSDHFQLNEVAKTLREGRTAEPTTIREFLSWFEVQRRTALNVKYINDQLERCGVQTVPSYLDRWVDSPIGFEHVGKDRADGQKGKHNKTAASEISTGGDEASSEDDPSFRIGNIESARNKPTSIKPNAPLQEAITIMLVRGFSQLPVMISDRDVKGVISWSSIGSRLAANTSDGEVRQFMDHPQEVSVRTSLFQAIRTIAEHDYVLVKDTNNVISGIVTASDIALQFEDISRPFLLLAEIENSVRALISKKLDRADIEKACGVDYLPQKFDTVHDLTFGNYVRVFQNPDAWNKIGLALDRNAFCSELYEVNRIRNDVMHFNPDPPTAANMRRLQDIATMFHTLRRSGAY